MRRPRRGPGAPAARSQGTARVSAEAQGARGSFFEVLSTFLRLGVLAFGGPVAHIAMMEDEYVRRRNWLSSESFSRALAATNLVPGPNSTEMAIHLGHRRKGFAGGLLSGFAFIVPAAIMVGVLSWAYFEWGTTPRVEDFLIGIRPAIVVLVALAAWRLRRPALRGPMPMALAAAAFVVAVLAAPWVLFVLLGAGVLALLVRWAGWTRLLAALPAMPIAPHGFQMVAWNTPDALAIALIHLKTGALLFGGGYVMIPLLQPDAVAQGWVTDSQFLDGIAIGQSTPGPIVTTATFVGYAAAGWWGAALATVAVFAPAFVFAMSLGTVLDRLSDSPNATAFLDAVAAAVFGAIAGAALVLLLELELDVLNVVLVVASGVVLLRGWVPSYAWLAAAGAAGLAYGAVVA
ncbi:MAG: chromate efflux transporter [Chloroflexi bacterium]|nr:chromate efflux transporter [Chloroflexota bacterium]